MLLADASAHIYESESSNLPVVDGMTSTLAAQNGSGDYFNASDVLRHAIEDNTISVLYQPIFDVNTKRITSLDTIVRVHDAKGRTLAPYFVTAEAHRLNMSVQLTLDVLETCVKDMTAFRKVAPELDIVDICMNGSELGASIFHERLEQLTHEQPQLRFGLQLGSHAIHVVHDEVDDEVAALAALPNIELGLTNAGTSIRRLPRSRICHWISHDSTRRWFAISVRLAQSRSCSARSRFRAITMRSMWCSMAWSPWTRLSSSVPSEARSPRARC